MYDRHLPLPPGQLPALTPNRRRLSFGRDFLDIFEIILLQNVETLGIEPAGSIFLHHFSVSA